MEKYFGAADRYEIISSIGKGGMGEVYRVYDRFSNDDRIALKVISSTIRVPNTKLLKNEFLLLSMLSHPNLIKVYDLGLHKREIEYIYYTMEYVEQSNLDETYSLLDYEKKLHIIKLILQALLYIHSRGILHLDLKPKNILIPVNDSKERLKIIDFGLSDLKINLQSLNTSKGSLAFVAPEVIAKEHKIDERSDLFSLGALILRIFSGKLFRLYSTNDREIKALLCKYLPEKLVKFAEQLLYLNRNRRFSKTSVALNYYLDLMNLKPYTLSRDDYIEILGRNPQYLLDTKVNEIINSIELKDARKIQVCGIKGTGKTRLINELEIYIRTKGYKTFFIGRNLGSQFQNYIVSELSIQGIITNEDKQKLTDEISNIISGYSSSKISNIKSMIAYKIADFFHSILSEMVILIDNINMIPKHERDILNIFLSIPDVCMAYVITHNRYIPMGGYDYNVIMSNFSSKETAKFIELCMGLREINPKSISEIYSATGGNPGRIKEYISASLNHRIIETPEGLILTVPPEIGMSDKGDWGQIVLNNAVKRLSVDDMQILFLLEYFPKPLSAKEIEEIISNRHTDIKQGLKRLVKSGLVNYSDHFYSSVYSIPQDIFAGTLTNDLKDGIMQKMADYISENRNPYNPYKILHIFKSTDRLFDGLIEIFNIVILAYKSGNPYNALDILNFLIREFKSSKCSVETKIKFDLGLSAPYFNKILDFSLLNLNLLRAKLLMITGSYRKSIRALKQQTGHSDDPDLIYHIKYSIALNLLHLREYDLVYGEFQKIMTMIEDRCNYYFYQSLSQQCWIHIQKGEIDKCQALLSKYYDDVKTMPVTLKMSQAALYYSRSMFDEAIELMLAVTEKDSKMIDKSTISKVYNNLGLLYRQKGDIEKSRHYFTLSYAIKKEIGAYESISSTYNNMGSIYLSENNIEMAYYYYNKAVRAAEMVDDKAGMVSASVNIAYIYNLHGDYQQSINQINKVIPLVSTIDSQGLYFHIYIISFQAMVIQKRFDRAYYYLDNLKEIVEKSQKSLFSFEYKLNLLYLSIIELNENKVDSLLSEISNNKAIKSNPAIFDKYFTMLIDWTLLRSVANPALSKISQKMIEIYLKEKKLSESIDNYVIKYALCHQFLTGKVFKLRTDLEDLDSAFKENMRLLWCISKFIPAFSSADPSQPFLVFHRSAGGDKVERSKTTTNLVIVLNKLNEMEHVYLPIIPYIIYKLLIFFSENDLLQESELLKKYFHQKMERLSDSCTDEARSIYRNSPVIQQINEL